MTERGRQGRQKGKQQHSEGQQGPKTTARQREILQSGPHEEPRHQENALEQEFLHPGEHRLLEPRQQHDEAEKNSEKTRLSREIHEHDELDRSDFQVQDGDTRHPKLPPEN